MNLKQACEAIANRFELDAIELLQYAESDKIGGWDETNNNGKTRLGNPHWPVGSVWEVEAKIIYALARVTNSKYAINLGHRAGCSAEHIAQALMDNKTNGGVYSVDINKLTIPLPSNVKFVQSDVMDYTFPSKPKVDFVFEDILHTPEIIGHIWGQFVKRAKKGAFIISHDSEHYLVGKMVREGIDAITTDYLSILPHPAKCGLAIWRKP